LKEEALDRTMWRNRFGGGFGPVVRQNTEWMKERGLEGPSSTILLQYTKAQICSQNKCYVERDEGRVAPESIGVTR